MTSDRLWGTPAVERNEDGAWIRLIGTALYGLLALVSATVGYITNTVEPVALIATIVSGLYILWMYLSVLVTIMIGISPLIGLAITTFVDIGEVGSAMVAAVVAVVVLAGSMKNTSVTPFFVGRYSVLALVRADDL
jgi:hypothetical protein